MFTGIIEALGKVESIKEEGTNRHFILNCPFTSELKTDQSLAHNGVCLTVTSVADKNYSVTAVKETLLRTNLANIKTGDLINLERCMKADGRFDGHIVQGHIDQTAVCKSIIDQEGSWLYTFEYNESSGNITLEKGSVTVNGVSLTVVESRRNTFSVAIIPYTHNNTNFYLLKEGDVVNIEFDILGKYIQKYLRENHSS